MPLTIRVLQPPLSETFMAPGFLRALDRASAGRREWPDDGVQELFRSSASPAAWPRSARASASSPPRRRSAMYARTGSARAATAGGRKSRWKRSSAGG